MAQWIEQFRPKEEVVRSTRTRVTIAICKQNSSQHHHRFIFWVFVRSGNVHIGIGRLRFASFYCHYRSRNALDYSSPVGAYTAKDYYLGFHASDVGPSAIDYRWNGFPLRCLAL